MNIQTIITSVKNLFSETAEKLKGKINLKKPDMQTTLRAARLVFVLFIQLYFAVVGLRIIQFRHPSPVKPLTDIQRQELNASLDSSYPERNNLIKPLPYQVVPAKLDIKAASAIIIDTASGSILFEKKADKVIPPASMTKLAVMYVAFQEIAEGHISLSDVVPLPKDCWACNMPPHSSLMFLGEGQHVTVAELLTGLAVCSGNDAAYALADYISGSMDAFILRMNSEMKNLGLKETRYVESSGYSADNSTTAREMAEFARVYINKYPEALTDYHSRLTYTYPAIENLSPEDQKKPTAQNFSKGLPAHLTMGITQENTNKLLGKLPGCDGLKTGYIDESGYNIALTARRDRTRFLSVTMGGPGRNVLEGNKYRAEDGTTLMEWAFRSFADFDEKPYLEPKYVPVKGGRSLFAEIVPAYNPESLTVPFVAGKTPQEAASLVKAEIRLPNYLRAGFTSGTHCGSVTFTLNGHVLETVPLTTAKTIKKASALIRAADALAVPLTF